MAHIQREARTMTHTEGSGTYPTQQQIAAALQQDSHRQMWAAVKDTVGGGYTMLAAGADRVAAPAQQLASAWCPHMPQQGGDGVHWVGCYPSSPHGVMLTAFNTRSFIYHTSRWYTGSKTLHTLGRAANWEGETQEVAPSAAAISQPVI